MHSPSYQIQETRSNTHSAFCGIEMQSEIMVKKIKFFCNMMDFTLTILVLPIAMVRILIDCNYSNMSSIRKDYKCLAIAAHHCCLLDGSNNCRIDESSRETYLVKRFWRPKLFKFHQVVLKDHFDW